MKLAPLFALVICAAGCPHPEPPVVETKTPSPVAAANKSTGASRPSATTAKTTATAIAPVPATSTTAKSKKRALPTDRDRVFAAMLINGMELKLAPDIAVPTYVVNGVDLSVCFHEEDGAIRTVVVGFGTLQPDQGRAIAICARLIAEVTDSNLNDVIKPLAAMLQTVATNMRNAQDRKPLSPAGFTLNGCQVFATNIGVVVAIGIEPLAP